MKFCLKNILEQRKKNKFLELTGILYLKIRNLLASQKIAGGTGPVVCLTTFGPRLSTVYLAIESIGRGEIKPSRLILWISDQEKESHVGTRLKRLVNRGLEIKKHEDCGPHMKYFPYACSIAGHKSPLVTADDDVLYPKYWLRKLWESHITNRNNIICYRAHVIGLENGTIAPYASWKPCATTRPSMSNFATGVSGVLYPPEFLDFVRERGPGFENKCPKADDVWLHFLALENSRPVQQIQNTPVHFVEISGSRISSLNKFNVKQGGNDIQIVKTYSAGSIKKIIDDMN